MGKNKVARRKYIVEFYVEVFKVHICMNYRKEVYGLNHYKVFIWIVKGRLQKKNASFRVEYSMKTKF